MINIRLIEYVTGENKWAYKPKKVMCKHKELRRIERGKDMLIRMLYEIHMKTIWYITHGHTLQKPDMCSDIDFFP